MNMLVASASAVSIAAVPANAFGPNQEASDQVLLDLERKFNDAWQALNEACDQYVESEKLMFEWLRRNPKPVMRECQVPAHGSVAYEDWFQELALAEEEDVAAVMARDPNKDLKAAMAEHEAVMKAWKARKKIAEAQSKHDVTEKAEGATGIAVQEVIDTIIETRASTMVGIYCKARIAQICSGDDSSGVALSLAQDLLAMNQDAPRLVPAAA